MTEWLPRLTAADTGVLALTIALCLVASRVPSIGDAVGRLWLRWVRPK